MKTTHRNESYSVIQVRPTPDRGAVWVNVRSHRVGRARIKAACLLTPDELRELIAELTAALTRTEGPTDAQG
ncbi:MAG: hypothetical protein H6523_15310 [Mycolicibacterium sp.]|nr:hypothetical protein [Mycolicibacterium sp.]